MSGAHAFLAPSAAGRWVHCALSPSLEAKYPEHEADPASLEGEAAHWVVQQRLLGADTRVGQQAPNGVAVTEQMLEGAVLVLDDIRRALGQEMNHLFIEQPVLIPRVHRDNWGTPDYRAWTRLDNRRLCLFIWDYKFGHGIVEAYENWQLIDYVAGVLAELGPQADDREVIVDMRIIQPRAYHREGPVRSWRCIASDLRGYFNKLEMAAEDATSKTPTANPHPDACENCKGRHACEALQRRAYRVADKAQHYAALDLPPAALGLELRELKRAQALLEARVSGLEAEVEAQLKAGKRVPFWAMQTSPGRLSWNKSTQEVLALGQMVGVDLAKPAEPITPTQAIALKVPEGLVKAYASRPNGTAKLAYDDGSKARLTFSSSVA